MATIHPSRLGLVPQNSRGTNKDRQRGRSPSPRESRRRSPSRSRSPENRRDKERDRNGYDDRSKKNGRARADDYFDGKEERPRRRSRSDDRHRDREREERREKDRPRRASPEYSEYNRPGQEKEDGSGGNAPWRQQENMYPNRHERPPHNDYGGGGSEWMERYVQIELCSTYVKLRSYSTVGGPNATQAL